jgi:4-diphosphocytidyl-2-C-methyl-D-erythritol kinase
MAKFVAQAYGKINLALYVLGSRPDGYHNIATVLQAVETHDTLEFEIADRHVTLTCSDPSLSTGEDNLVMRAVRLLEREAGRQFELGIHLDKSLPIGAGMGGGSADAACVLRSINRLLELKISEPCLRQMALDLGSDVPFFLTGGQALAEGRGERLIELNWPLNYSILIAFPNLVVPAAEGYRRAKISLTNPLACHTFHCCLTLEEFWSWVGSQDNDLAAGVTATYPAVARGITAIRSLGARYAGMTGSGSAVFGLFDRPLTSDDWERWLVSGTWKVWATRPVRIPS